MGSLTTIQNKEDEKYTYRDSSEQEFKFVIEGTANELSSDDEESKHSIYNYVDTGRGSSSKFLAHSKQYDEEANRTSSINSEMYQDDEINQINFHHKVFRPQSKRDMKYFSSLSDNNNEIELEVRKRPSTIKSNNERTNSGKGSARRAASQSEEQSALMSSMSLNHETFTEENEETITSSKEA